MNTLTDASVALGIHPRPAVDLLSTVAAAPSVPTRTAGPSAPAAPADFAAPVAAAAAPAPAAPQPPKPVFGNSSEDQRRQAVYNECTDLLKLATDLKSAVGKSTKDELSIAVVRKAGEIEQYAHKVRTGAPMAAGKN